MDNTFSKKYPEKIKSKVFDPKDLTNKNINSKNYSFTTKSIDSSDFYSKKSFVNEENQKLSDDLKTQSNKNLIFWISIIIVSAIIIIGIILFLIFFFDPQDEKTKRPTGIEPEDLDIGSYPEYKLNPGLNTSGFKLPTQEAIEKSLLNGSKLNLNMQECNDINVVWNNSENKCVCRFPFFGPYCVNEFHSNDYVNFGYVENFTPPVPMYSNTENSSGNVLYSVQSIPDATSLTFSSYNTVDPTSCTSLCNKDFSCKGVSYNLVGNKYYCSFLRDDIRVIGDTDVVINLEKNLGIYLHKGKSQPKFLNKVFVYAGKRPPVYWIKREGVLRDLLGNSPIATDISNKDIKPSKLTDIIQNTVVELTWYPERIVNDGALVGVWSTKPFLPEQYSSLKAGGNTKNVYIDLGGGKIFGDYPLNLPKDFIVPDKIYAMYA